MKRKILCALLLGPALLAADPQEGRPPASGLLIQKNVAVGTKRCDVVSWTDAGGKPRTVSLVRADGDHPGFSGGYIQKYTYVVDSTVKTGLAWDAAQENVSGLGCAVNHHKGASSSKAQSSNATSGFVFEGANHCLWRFHSTFSGDGRSVGLTIDWLISQGRSDVLWAVSYDCTGNPVFNWDARGPYFQFDWDGDGKFYEGPISGIRWGDHYRFRTTTFDGAASAWDYTQPNTVPYMMLYKEASIGDVEAGVVQTQPWSVHDAGGYWWAQGHWGKTGTGMPENWNCPFQLNAYEGYKSEKMAWGTNFGYVGNGAYSRLDNAPQPGTPHQGYSTAIILNRHSEGLTDLMIASLEAVQRTTLSATKGTVVGSGPAHANLAGDAVYQPAGWNHVYGAWAVALDAGQTASIDLRLSSGTLARPLFTFTHYMGAHPPTSLQLDGSALVAGKDYVASVNAATQTLWVTLLRNLSGSSHALVLKG
jgi:hypothetical protein